MWTSKLWTFKYVNVCSHSVTWVSSCVWLTLLRAYILYTLLCFSALFCIVQHRLQWWSIIQAQGVQKWEGRQIDLNPAGTETPRGRCQARVKLQLAPRLLFLVSRQLYHLPLPPPSDCSSSCLFTGFQPWYARCTLLSYYKVPYCKIKLFLYFLFSIFM